jgi:hypothetical protein
MALVPSSVPDPNAEELVQPVGGGAQGEPEINEICAVIQLNAVPQVMFVL